MGIRTAGTWGWRRRWLAALLIMIFVPFSAWADVVMNAYTGSFAPPMGDPGDPVSWFCYIESYSTSDSQYAIDTDTYLIRIAMNGVIGGGGATLQTFWTPLDTFLVAGSWQMDLVRRDTGEIFTVETGAFAGVTQWAGDYLGDVDEQLYALLSGEMTADTGAYYSSDFSEGLDFGGVDFFFDGFYDLQSAMLVMGFQGAILGPPGDNPNVAPEPSTMILYSLGLVGLIAGCQRRKRNIGT